MLNYSKFTWKYLQYRLLFRIVRNLHSSSLLCPFNYFKSLFKQVWSLLAKIANWTSKPVRTSYLITCFNWEWVRDVYMILLCSPFAYFEGLELPILSEICWCFNQLKHEQSNDRVFPVPVGLCTNAFAWLLRQSMICDRIG